MGNVSLDFKAWLLVGGVLLLTWLALQSKKIFHKKVTALHWKGKPIQIFETTFTLVTFYFSALTIFQILGLDLWPLLTLSGIGAAVVGFASRDLFSNLFGGMTISVAQLFSVDDFIELPEKKISGTVEEIGWYFTTVRDLGKKVLYIPNALFSAEFLLNHSRATHRLVEEKIWIRDVERLESILPRMRQWMERCSEIDAKEPMHVAVSSIRSWGVEVNLSAYTRAKESAAFVAFKEKMLLEMYDIMQRRKSEHEIARGTPTIPAR